MIATHWIVEIMSVVFLMPTWDFGGTVMMKISLKLLIYQKGLYYIEESQEKKEKR